MPNKALIKHLFHVKNIVIDSYKYCPEDDEFTLFAHSAKDRMPRARHTYRICTMGTPSCIFHEEL